MRHSPKSLLDNADCPIADSAFLVRGIQSAVNTQQTVDRAAGEEHSRRKYRIFRILRPNEWALSAAVRTVEIRPQPAEHQRKQDIQAENGNACCRDSQDSPFPRKRSGRQQMGQPRLAVHSQNRPGSRNGVDQPGRRGSKTLVQGEVANCTPANNTANANARMTRFFPRHIHRRSANGVQNATLSQLMSAFRLEHVGERSARSTGGTADATVISLTWRIGLQIG